MKVFISYAREDINAARRLYQDLKNANLNPWLDKEFIPPGRNWESEIIKAIKNSRYFISLNSSNSVQKKGFIQKELKRALEAQEEFPESAIFIIPVRLDDCQITYQKLNKIQYADLFPDWNKGLEKIIHTMEIERQQKPINVDKVKTKLENSVVNIELALTPSKIFTQFKGEKEFFVGRRGYLNKKIRNAINSPGSHVSLMGPGGSGKTQLAFKAIHQYEEEKMFDLVIPIYFDLNLMPLSQLLSSMAENLGLPIDEFDKYDIEKRKSVIRNELKEKHHPLVFLDNYETISFELNDKSKQPQQSAIDISNFLNDNIPNNTSILLTSRERYNNLAREDPIDLEGLGETESKDLFNALVLADKLLRNPKSEKVKNQIENLLKKTGGHPLSIELIAKNITSVEELEGISRSLGTKEVNWAAPEERFRSLQACFGYTINKLNITLQQLLPKLTIFKSPFPISAVVEIFGVNKSNVINLYNRSFLTRIESDDIYGRVEDPEYLLYNVHPAMRNYLDNLSHDLGGSQEFEYNQKYSQYYYKLLCDTNSAIGKKNYHLQLARFQIIFQGENNDFARSIDLTNNIYLSADIARELGILLSVVGQPTQALQFHQTSLRTHESLADKKGVAADYTNIALIYNHLGNFKEALKFAENALGFHKSLADKKGVAADYTNMGIAYDNMGNFKEALHFHNKALDIDIQENRQVGIAADYRNIGIANNHLGNFKEALDFHNKALDIDKSQVGIAAHYRNIGVVHDNMGNFKEALDFHNKALDIDKHLNNRERVAIGYSDIGIVLDKMGKSKEALDNHFEALAIRKLLDDKVGMAVDYTNIGNAYKNMQKYQQAREAHGNAFDIDKALDNRMGMMTDYTNIGGVHESAGNFKEALDCYRRALAICRNIERRT